MHREGKERQRSEEIRTEESQPLHGMQVSMGDRKEERGQLLAPGEIRALNRISLGHLIILITEGKSDAIQS